MDSWEEARRYSALDERDVRIKDLERENAELRERVERAEQALSNISLWIPASIQHMSVEQLVIWLLVERALRGESSEIPDSVPLKAKAMERYELVHGERTE